MQLGVGLDSITAPITGSPAIFQTQTAGTYNSMLISSTIIIPPLGSHALNGMEFGSSGTASTFNSDATATLSVELWI